MPGTGSVSDFGFFSDFGILAYCNETVWGWEPNLNAKYIYVSCTAHEYIGICMPFWHFQKYLCTTEQRVSKTTKSNHSGIFHVRRHVGAKKVSDFGGFRISEFRITDIQPVLS
jgi:hypothetical protein